MLKARGIVVHYGTNRRIDARSGFSLRTSAFSAVQW